MKESFLVLYVDELFIDAGFDAYDDRIFGAACGHSHDSFLHALILCAPVGGDDQFCLCLQTADRADC